MSLTSMTLAGDELLDLPRNEQDLADYLLLLAGADVTGDLETDVLANFIVDGFEDGRLPGSRSNLADHHRPDSLSADGRGGARIEIVTRPRTGRWMAPVGGSLSERRAQRRQNGEVVA